MDNECIKRRYTKKEAVTALNFIRENRYGRQYRKEMRYYHCPLCNNWHLTSKEFTGLEQIEEIDHILQKEKWMKFLAQDDQQTIIYEGKSNI
jgi:hypothetical protein